MRLRTTTYFLFAGLLCLLWLSACNTAPTSEELTAASESPTLLPAPATSTETAVPISTPDPPTAVPTATELSESAAVPSPAAEAEAGDDATSSPTVEPDSAVEEDETTITGDKVFFPFTAGNTNVSQAGPEDNPLPTAPAVPIPSPTALPTVDFAAVRAELQANGQALGFAKLGFHTTIFENRDVLDNWMQSLDAAGVPLFIKTVDNAEPLFRAQTLRQASGVPHVLVFRSSGSVPHYELPAAQAAQLHWTEHRDKFPPELDPNLIWIETLNEPDRTQSEWLGQFALETARLAMADGFRWAAFGWASGEPEPAQWQTPSMLAFLRLAGENPEQLAVALHEYSYLEGDIAHEYPYKVGRFQELFKIADTHGFARPTVLITEWGWQYNDIPPTEQVLSDLDWAAKLYAPYPEVKGAAIWNIGAGCCFDDISEQVQQIIEPITRYALTHYFAVPLPPARQAINPQDFRP